MFVSGVFLCGSCNLLFAALDLVEDDTKFLILCFAVRGLAAVGASAFSTAGATFVADLFPDKISAVMVIFQSALAIEIYFLNLFQCYRESWKHLSV